MSFRVDFIAGSKAITPLLPPGATVGLVTGVAATAVGLSPLEAISMSVVVYSPTVMLTAFQLLETGTPMIVLVVTSLVVGVRFAMLSLSIASYFRDLATGWKWLLAYFLWTPTYALSIERFEADPQTKRHAFYLGTAVPLWLVFQTAMLAGILFGARVPAALNLGFIVPLAFIALLMRMLRNRATVGAAGVAGIVAVLTATVPFNLGIVIATTCGVGGGIVFTKWVTKS